MSGAAASESEGSIKAKKELVPFSFLRDLGDNADNTNRLILRRKCRSSPFWARVRVTVPLHSRPCTSTCSIQTCACGEVPLGRRARLPAQSNHNQSSSLLLPPLLPHAAEYCPPVCPAAPTDGCVDVIELRDAVPKPAQPYARVIGRRPPRLSRPPGRVLANGMGRNEEGRNGVHECKDRKWEPARPVQVATREQGPTN